jgi:hypothetical protein
LDAKKQRPIAAGCGIFTSKWRSNRGRIAAKALTFKGLPKQQLARREMARQLPFSGSDRKTILFGKAILVQKIGWIVAILCAASWLASEIDLPGKVQNISDREEIVWRRTIDGWEKMTDWTFAAERTPPVLHPGIVGLLMAALSLTAGMVNNRAAKS